MSPVIYSQGSSFVPPTDPNIPPPNPPSSYQTGGIGAQVRVSNIPLINGTQTLASYTAPNDGNIHTVLIAAALKVTSAETGGQINAHASVQGLAAVFTVVNASQAITAGTSVVIPVDPGTTVTVSQDSALTAGAATFTATISAQ